MRDRCYTPTDKLILFGMGMWLSAILVLVLINAAFAFSGSLAFQVSNGLFWAVLAVGALAVAREFAAEFCATRPKKLKRVPA